MFHLAGAVVESFALVTGRAAPLTRDIVRAGMTSAVADNSRMRGELLHELTYPTFETGLKLL
jgi:hypothetical protein